MSISQSLCTSFKVEILNGIHAFSSVYRTADTFKIALYTSVASLDETITVYAATDEVIGTGYVSGGATMTPVAPTSSGTTAFIDFTDVTWSSATLAADGALIYNSTQGNKAVAVLSFGGTKTSTNGNFKIQFPVADATNAVLRIA